ncbi:MAG: EamA family transporter [Steroidobacteraceae bacterium]
MQASTHPPRSRLILCFAIVYLVWGSTYAVTKVGVHELPPFLFGAVRFLTGGALLWAVARRLGHAPARIPRTEWKHLVIVAIGAVLMSNGSSVWGLQYVPSNLAALLNVSAAFWIALLGTVGRRAHPLTARAALGLAIGFVGTALVVWTGRADAAHASAGAAGLLWPSFVILVGCAGWAMSTIYMRNVSTSLHLLPFTGLQMCCGGLMLLAIALARGEPALWHWSGPGLAALAYMTIFSSCIAYTAYAWLSVHATPAQVGTYGFVNPLIAATLGWIALGEVMSPAQLVGSGVILAGVLLVNWPSAEAAPESPG